jgi:hypothetical protein
MPLVGKQAIISALLLDSIHDMPPVTTRALDRGSKARTASAAASLDGILAVRMASASARGIPLFMRHYEVEHRNMWTADPRFGRSGALAAHWSLKFFACLGGQSVVIATLCTTRPPRRGAMVPILTTDESHRR